MASDLPSLALWPRLWIVLVEVAEALLPPGRRTEAAPLETAPASISPLRQRAEQGLEEDV